MDEPLRAHTSNELHFFLMVTPCAHCGRGPLVPEGIDLPAAGGEGDPDPLREATIRTHCKRCGFEADFRFRWEHDVPADADGPGCVNPSRQPSRIVDLGQWVSLYHMFSESAASADSPVDARRSARQASLCLSEALKFYRDEELPPESALFREASAAAFRENPANFARTRLRDLQAMLPAPAHHPAPAPSPQDDPH
ncbi:MAG: hypothetical protein WBF17_21990, partial [Phycisphaerae bacterium]